MISGDRYKSKTTVTDGHKEDIEKPNRSGIRRRNNRRCPQITAHHYHYVGFLFCNAVVVVTSLLSTSNSRYCTWREIYASQYEEHKRRELNRCREGVMRWVGWNGTPLTRQSTCQSLNGNIIGWMDALTQIPLIPTSVCGYLASRSAWRKDKLFHSPSSWTLLSPGSVITCGYCKWSEWAAASSTHKPLLKDVRITPQVIVQLHTIYDYDCTIFQLDLFHLPNSTQAHSSVEKSASKLNELWCT